MAIIDAHVHLYPPEVNRAPADWAAACGEAHWATLCTRRRKDGRPVQAFPSLDQLLRDMDAAGVTKAVLLGWYWERPETCQMQNRFYAECLRAHPDRLAAFAAIHPAMTPGEVAWAEDSGFAGLGELSPHSQGVGLRDRTIRAMVEEAGRRKLAVNLHVTDPQSKRYPGWVETPLADFVQLAHDFPETNFILAHWGGGLAWSAEAAALPNVWFDTAASPLLYGPEVWAKAKSERVLFGSDYPLVLYPQVNSEPGFGGLIAEARKEGVSAAVLGGNAAGLLSL
ncbi:MAG TPA: amidohydrolase family protein [Lacunisphaera sp.]|nr:amidohydrolase family protein [Lacunisphaera sp.]